MHGCDCRFRLLVRHDLVHKGASKSSQRFRRHERVQDGVPIRNARTGRHLHWRKHRVERKHANRFGHSSRMPLQQSPFEKHALFYFSPLRVQHSQRHLSQRVSVYVRRQLYLEVTLVKRAHVAVHILVRALFRRSFPVLAHCCDLVQLEMRKHFCVKLFERYGVDLRLELIFVEKVLHQQLVAFTACSSERVRAIREERWQNKRPVH
mmetsp:Transcript_6148/g.16376  ORF Transcript_6148/g.16376 Transcript_6148/m.16376 type:complete len:207 (+) Transcript_6148:624-1244(+)